MKEADDNLGIFSRFLRASRGPFHDGNQRVFDAALASFYEPEDVAVSAMKKLIAGSSDRVQTVDQGQPPIDD